MPIARFEMPDGRIARFEVPPGTSPEEAQRMIGEMLGFETPAEPQKTKEAPTVGGQLKEFAKGLVPGAIGLAESAGTGISALLPDEQERAARRAISSLAASAREPFAAAPGYEETVGRKLGESVGSVVPFFALGPFGVAGRLGMAGLGVGAGAGEARTRAEQGGATAEQRALATGLGGVVGATEMFAPARILGRLSAPVQAGAVAAVKRALVAGGEEAAQEAASQIAQNLIAKGIYKPEQEIVEQVGESAAYGGATGALVQGLLDLAIGRRARGAAPAGAAAQPTQQPGVAPITPPVAGEAETIPEPTLRAPEAPPEEEAVAEPTKREAAKQAKAAKDQAERLAKEQAAFLKRYEAQAEERARAQAEYERIKTMTPEEFFLYQQGVKVPAEKPQISAEEAFIDRLGEGPAETEKPLSPLQQYAVTQIKAAQSRPYGFTTEDVLAYLMQDAAKASKLVEERPPIPGLSDTKTDALYNKLKLQVNASLKQNKQAGAAATIAAKQRLGTVEEEEQAALEAQRAEEERIAQDAEIARRVAPERLGIQRLGQEPGRVVLPEGGYASDTGKLLSERFPSKQEALSEEEGPLEDIPLVDQLIKTLPLTNGRITPGRVVEGVGASPSQNLKDLQTQFQIARITRDRKTQEALLTEMRTAKDQGAVEGRGKLTRELQEGMLPEERAQEAAADQHADTQRMQLLGLIKTLDAARTGKLILPAKREAQISAAKEAFVAAHAAEIEARRKAFGLPAMADWEKAEARARSLEALNELESRYSTFGAPAQAVKVLQGQTREAIYQNLQNAATRMLEQGQVDLEGKTKKPGEGGQKYYFTDAEGNVVEGKEMEVPRETGPRIAAPDELTLRGEPREAKTEKQRALNVIEMVLRSAETRTRAMPVLEKQEARTLADLAKILAAAKVSGNTSPGFLATGTPTKTDAATVELLTRLRNALETTNDPEFISLAREQATMVAEGNLPNPFAVRDLDEMLKAQEAAGRSAAAPLSKEETAAVARGEKLTFTGLEGKTRTKVTEAQPQLEMFPEAGVQVARATPSNFQKMLDSKDVQGMRDAIEKQRKDNLAVLQSVGKALPTITNRYNAAKTKHDKNVKKAREKGELALGWKQDMRSDLDAVIAEAQDARTKHIIPLQQALREIEEVKAAILQEPSDMRMLLKINNLLAQEPALRKKLADWEAVITPLEDLAAQIGAEITAYTDVAQPAVKKFKQAQAEADKTKAELDKVTQEKREAERIEQAGVEAQKRKADEEAAAEETRLRQVAQRAREGLGLEGVRLEKDTTRMRQEQSKIRRAIGSLNEQLDKATDESTKAKLREKIAEQETKLENVFQDAPLVKTELRTREDEAARRETEDRRAAAEALVAARRRKAKGEKAPRLKPVTQSPLMKDVLGSRVTQPRPQASLEEVGVAVTNRLIKVNADLAEVQRRMQFLRDTGKAKVKGKLTPLMKELEAKEATIKGMLSALRQRQSKVSGAAKAATLTYTKAKEAEEKLQSKRQRRGEIEFSIGQPAAGLTAVELQKELDKAIGGKGVTQRRVQVFDSVADFYTKDKNAQYDYPDLPTNAKAFVDPKTGQAFMFADNIGKGEALGVLLHEVGVHLGFRNLFNKAQYDSLITAVKNWAKKNDGSLESRVAQAAMARVKAAKTSAEQYNDELLAYSVEEAIKAGVNPSALKNGSPIRNWLATVLALLKKALGRFGINADNLTAGDLVNLAYGAAQLEVRGTWHGSDATFTAFDTKYAGTGEGAFDRRFDGDNSLGAGPYVTPDREYAEYYQHAIPMGKAANETGYGNKTYQDYRDMDEKFMTKNNDELSVAELQNKYESVLLTKYLQGVSAGGALNPVKNGSVLLALENFKQIKDPRVVKAIATLSADKIKGLTERPPKGTLYRTLDDIPSEKILSVNSNATVGERPKIDALREKYGKNFITRKDGTKIDMDLKDGKYPLNSMFYKMRRDLGIDKTIQLLKNAGIEAVEQVNDRKYIERAYIDNAPEILGMNLEPIGPAEGLLFSKAKAPGFEDALSTSDKLIAKPKSIGQQIQANLGLAGRTQWLDRLAPLEKIAREMADPFKGTRMMYYLRMADQKMSFVQQSVARGVPQLVDHKRADGQVEKLIESVEGPNLAGVVETLKGAPGMNAEAANRLFTLYLANKRAENPNVGYDKLNYGIPKDQIQRAAQQIERNPEVRAVFEKARTQYNDYNRALMKFMEDTGALSPEEAKRLAATNDYIPYYRERNGNAELVIGGEGTFKVGNLKDQPQLQQLIGGDQKIYDFLTSSVQNTSVLLDAALRNQATKNAMIDLVDMGLARFIGATSGPDVVSFKLKGEDKYVLVETDKTGIPADLLVKGMAGIPVNNSAIVRAMGYAATLVRKGVMLNPLYPVKQLFRDSTAAPILSGADFTPVMGAVRQLGKSATKETLEARGITGGQVFTGTNEDLTRILKDFQAGKMGLSQLVARAEAIAMEADAATRRAQYDSYIRQGLSEMEATLMSLESMNFNRKGLSPSARFLATTIPFFNAQVQSLDVLYRALTGKMPMSERLDIQGKLLRRGALLAGTAVAYALLMQDDEAYKNATPEQKYGNFFVRLPGLDEPLRVPVPFEIGYIFKGIPEALVNSMANERGAEEALKAFRSIAIQTVPGGTSMLMPALAKPIIENVANYSFFTEHALESRAEQQMLPEYRFRDNTSEVAKQVGMLTGTSPLKIENLIRGYTGTMGLALAQSLNFAMPAPPKGTPEQATKRLSDTPVIGAMFQPNDAAGIVSATYDRMLEVQQIDKTFKDMVKDGRMSEAREFLQKNANEIGAAAVAGNIQEQLNTITKAMNAIKASNLSPDKKREELDKLQKLRIKLAESTRGYLG